MGNYKTKLSECRKRAEELVSQMTLLEKSAQLKYDAAPIERLGVPAFNYWNEGLHGVARAGLATMFPQAIGMAALFDEDIMEKVGSIIATEGRAKYNAYSQKDDRDIYKGLTFWTPNVNVFRDPRWGRGHETYGEDPYLISRLGVALVNGIQGDDEFLKAGACAKHFAVHSGPENVRHEIDVQVSEKDLWETYLPAFEALVTEADVVGVMGAYNRVNGEPCCAHHYLMEEILREKWGFEGYYTSDCWAIQDFHMAHKVTSNARESAALAVNTGCDLNCGSTYLNMLGAHQDGLVSEETITESAVRLFTIRYALGLFDETEFDKISYDVVACKEHRDFSLEIARKSCVLLKNDGILPIDKSKIKTIGVIGPNADSRASLIGNYHGTPLRYVTVLEGIQDEVGDDVRVLYSEGCHLFDERAEGLAWRQDRISEAVITAEQSDVVVLCVGLDETLEGEEGDTGNQYSSGDKRDLHLPKVQEELLEKVVATGTPTIVVLLAGSAIDLNYADENCNSVLMAWYPGEQGGKAVADLLFGNESPSGKLPITFYHDLDDMPEFEDYSMTNRTYRYLSKEPLYPFGYGLTYGDVSVTEAMILNEVSREQDISLEVTVKNDSKVATDEVVQVYIKDLESEYAVKNTSLCAFKRIHVDGGESVAVQLTVPNKALTVVNENGERIIDSSKFKLYVGCSQPDNRSLSLTGKSVAELDINI